MDVGACSCSGEGDNSAQFSREAKKLAPAHKRKVLDEAAAFARGMLACDVGSRQILKGESQDNQAG